MVILGNTSSSTIAPVPTGSLFPLCKTGTSAQVTLVKYLHDCTYIIPMDPKVCYHLFTKATKINWQQLPCHSPSLCHLPLYPHKVLQNPGTMPGSPYLDSNDHVPFFIIHDWNYKSLNHLQLNASLKVSSLYEVDHSPPLA